MKVSSKLSVSLLCATSVMALSTASRAQEAVTETVVVTGSRVISDAANSPTPLTVVTTAQLLTNTPSNVPDALNKLPVFQGSSSDRSINNASTNGAGNVLSLRNFGAQRTLILLDGHRVAPSNTNGTTDIDTLPQMLMSRVEVVTGGASAVYGSDAVTGVVNFVLDKNFTGIKVDANAGISGFTDAASQKLGVAAGTSLFGGHGHISGSAGYYHKDGVRGLARPEGRIQYARAGAGTAANPYVTIPNPGLVQFSYGGKITCTSCTVSGQQFVANGVIGPFDPGTPSGTNNLVTGGDAARSNLSMITANKTSEQAFGRFSYDLDDTTNAYVQAFGGSSIDRGPWQNNYIQTGTVPNTFYKNNPFLTAAAQAALGNNGQSNATNTFQLAKYIDNQGPIGGFQTFGTQRTVGATAGVTGSLMGKYDWDLYYTHGDGRLKVDNPHNQNNQKMYAALDAVAGPTAGSVVCYASQAAVVGAAVAARFADCVPMNPFGRTALSKDAWEYFTDDSNYVVTNQLDNVGGSISGDLFELPAGQIKAALSAEARWMGYQVVSNAFPTDKIDCTGLRICNTSAVYWQGNIANSQPFVTGNVWEFAGEAEVPLLKQMGPLIDSLSMNIAGRFTDYSASGPVQTWKVGLDYHVNESIRFRATTSVDIRAPTLDDLYSPIQSTQGSYQDLHTGNTVALARNSSSGNPNLVPEVARTYTGGVVLTPSFIPGLTTSVDYYNITLKNVIGSVSGTSTQTQQICESSGGTHPYCALYIRPFPFSNTTPANFPTLVQSLQLNTAFNKIEGWDVEVNYGFQMEDLFPGVPGSVTLRSLANYQPVQQSQSFAGAALTSTALPKGHVTTFLNYKLGNWGFNIQNRLFSPYKQATLPTDVYAQPYGPGRTYFDITIDRKFVIDDSTLDAYLAVQDLLDQSIPIAPNNAVSPGLWYVGVQGANTAYDAIGRYFTLGVRASL